ncbi:MAG TPA: DUF393 domain-containing protein [Candidatus Latescibacteria bacterium]|nr:DUF393 domain-containing protein [Candidatus Handelsmanbacteria bacterium]HIL11745.1 DUF393 domain-containing protein [Candidatus Latescibacterota bacterium]
MSDNLVKLYFFYDNTCELCVKFKGWVVERDVTGEIEVLPLDEEGVEQRFPMVDFARVREQLTVCDPQGKAYEGGEALRMLARNVPGLALLDWAYGLPGVQSVAGGVYRRVNRVRKRLCLSCGEQWMPSKKYSERKRRAGRRWS